MPQNICRKGTGKEKGVYHTWNDFHKKTETNALNKYILPLINSILRSLLKLQIVFASTINKAINYFCMLKSALLIGLNRELDTNFC